MIFQQSALPKLDFNVTNKCNLRCIHCCFMAGETMFSDFDLEKIRTVLNDFKRLKGRRIDITGGEPLIRPDIYQIVDLCVNRLGLKTELVTNSLLLTPEKISAFRGLGLQGVAISLDGSTAEKHAHIRGTNGKDFQRVLENIRACAQAGFYTKVNSVVFASNLEDLVNITKLAIDLGAKEHGLYFFSPVGRGIENQAEVADPLRWLEIVRRELVRYKNQIELTIEVPVIEAEIGKKLDLACYLEKPWHLQILPNGKVYPCAIMAAYDLPLGDLYAEGLEDVWQRQALWNRGYYRTNVEPLMEKFHGCVNYNFSHLVASGEYMFACLCKKFKIEEICL